MRDTSEVMRAALVRIAMGADGAQKIADDAIAATRDPAAEPADAGRDAVAWIERAKEIAAQLAVDGMEGDAADLLDALAALSSPPGVQAAQVSDAAHEAIAALENAAFMLGGSAPSDLQPGIVESTGEGKTLLIAARNLRATLARCGSAAHGGEVSDA